jgi:hypothetical protein
VKLGKVMGFARRNYVVDGTGRESLMVIKNGRNGRSNMFPSQVEPGGADHQSGQCSCNRGKDASTNRFGRRLNTTVIL